MGEKVKGYLSKAKETAKNVTGKVSKKVWIIIAVVLVVVAIVITVILNNRPYSVLFADLSTDEASTIISLLEDMGSTDYRLEDGDTILVPTSQVYSLKAKLLQQGYPTSGFSYDSYWDKIGQLSTSAERNEAALEALQDRIAATIECMDGVRSAIVTLNQGEDRSYVLDSGNVVAASATVMVTMKDGGALGDTLANAIRTLVSTSMKGLEISSITVTDSLGNVYSGETNLSADSDASALKLQLEEQQNNKIRTEVLQTLIPFYGEDNVKVGVNTTIDVGYTEIDSTEVNQPTWAADGSTSGSGIIDSRVYSYSLDIGDEELAGGVVGTETNADNEPIYAETENEPTNNGNILSGEGQINYTNPTTQTHKVRADFTVTDCQISVSINSTVAGDVDTVSITRHVADAAGISAIATDTMTADEYLASKISVLALPFYVATAQPTITALTIFGVEVPQWLPYAVVAGVILLVLLIVLIVVAMNKSKKKKREAEAQAALEAAAMAGVALTPDEVLAAAAEGGEAPVGELATGADVMTLQSERGMELRKSIRMFVDENPELAAQMVRVWLRGGDEVG